MSEFCRMEVMAYGREIESDGIRVLGIVALETALRIRSDDIAFRGRHLSYQRGKRNTTPGTSLIKIEGVDDTKAAKYVADEPKNRK
jgi:hypothetical protein